jgi:hypothetical protein
VRTRPSLATVILNASGPRTQDHRPPCMLNLLLPGSTSPVSSENSVRQLIRATKENRAIICDTCHPACSITPAIPRDLADDAKT